MKDYYCPNCGRFLLSSDAPPGYKVRLPRCQGCTQRPLLTTGRDARDAPRQAVVARGSGTC